MRSLSPTLLEAQLSPRRRPYLGVTVERRLPHVFHPVFERLVNSDEAPARHDLLLTSGGTLIRARVTASGSRLQVQRVTNAGRDSDFNAWTYMNRAYPTAGVALCGNGSYVLMVYVNYSNRRELRYRESTDDGATWSSDARLVYPSVGGVSHVTAAMSPAGNVGLFYAGTNHNLYAMRRIDGTWGAPGSWPQSSYIRNISGISAAYGTDWNVVICGTTSSGSSRVWTAVYGDGTENPRGQWSGVTSMTRADSGSKVSFSHPYLAKADTFRLFFKEAYAGSDAYGRAFWTFTPQNSSFYKATWREPAPFNADPHAGIAIAGNSDALWLSTSTQLWLATSPSVRTLTADVLEADLAENASGGRATLLLRNDHGRYNGAGNEGASPLVPGARVRFSPGYVTSQGLESSSGPAYWIRALEHRTGGGKAQLALYLEDGWALLKRWRARYQHNWIKGYTFVADIVGFILARAGLDLQVLSASETFRRQRPAFTIHPNSTAVDAARRLMSTTPDVLFFRGGSPVVKLLSSDDEADYSYGNDHPVFRGRHLFEEPRYNRIQTYGLNTMRESLDWDAVAAVGDRLLQVYDINQEASDSVKTRSDSLLAKQRAATAAGVLEAPVNCGLELYDVVGITDPAAGLVGAKRRVTGIDLKYRRGPGGAPLYRQTLTLSRV